MPGGAKRRLAPLRRAACAALKREKQKGDQMISFSTGKNMPSDVGVIHFVGIGGIGMSGIAEVLHNLGYEVQGSDTADNYNVQRLRGLGVKVVIGHAAENISGASVVVKSTAVGMENPEIAAARASGIPVLRRSEMLAELTRLKATVAVAGTHGKTTTTSLVATLLEKGGLDPTIINGGILNAHGSNAKLGAGDWMVVEADESDGTFLRIPATVAVVTNIDPEHMDHWKDFDSLRRAFQQFVESIPFYGFAVLCIDHPEVQQLKAAVMDRKIVTYGFSPQADVRALNLRSDTSGSTFDVEISDRKGERRTLENIRIPLVGKHNVLNSLAAIGVALNLRVNENAIREGFIGFKGVKRRFTRTGTVDGVTIVDDYGHHPVEIAATMKAARQAVEGTGGRVLAVVQPHRFTRLRDLFAEFCTCMNDADIVWVADVYTAGESPIEGVNKEALAEGLRKAGHKDVRLLDGADVLADEIAAEAKSGDLVLCLGAGSITYWAQALPEQLEKIYKKSRQRA